MRRLGRVVAAARWLGLAPYRLSGCRFHLSPPWRAAGPCLLVLAFAISLGAQLVGNAPPLTQSLAQLGQLNGVLLLTVSCWCLPARQYPLLGRVLNSRVLQQGSEEATLAPALAILLFRCCGVLGSLSALLPAGQYVRAARRLGLLAWVLLHGAELALFAFLLGCVAVQFRRVHHELLRTPASFPWTIAHLRREHKQVQDLLGALVACFGVQSVCLLLLHLWWITARTYQTLLRIQSFDALDLFIAVLDLMQSTVWLVCFLEVAHRVAREGNSAMSTIHQLRNRLQVSRDEEVELERFAQQLTEEPVVVCVGNTVDLNRKLIFQAGAAVLSYAVILLQFRADYSD